MTNETAIKKLEDFQMDIGSSYDDLDNSSLYYTLELAIKALKDIEKIKAIIRTPKNFLEQDVYRYKMICEVIANKCKTESKESREE